MKDEVSMWFVHGIYPHVYMVFTLHCLLYSNVDNQQLFNNQICYNSKPLSFWCCRARVFRTSWMEYKCLWRVYSCTVCISIGAHTQTHIARRCSGWMLNGNGAQCAYTQRQTLNGSISYKKLRALFTIPSRTTLDGNANIILCTIDRRCTPNTYTYTHPTISHVSISRMQYETHDDGFSLRWETNVVWEQ